MDEELKAYLDGMMRRINDGNERLLTQIAELRADVRNLRSEHDVTRQMVTALPATVLGATG